MKKIKPKKLISISLISFFLMLIFINAGLPEQMERDNGGWKAGVARVVITPKESMWMAGYANRDHPSEGTLNDLWAKALAFEDAGGNRSVLVTMELRGIPKTFSDNIRYRLKTKLGLSRAQIILNVSHTHSGLVLNGVLVDIYPIDSIQNPLPRRTVGLAQQYGQTLAAAVERVLNEDMKALSPQLSTSYKEIQLAKN